MNNINIFKETKLQQIHQYEAKSRKFRALGGWLRFVMIVVLIYIVIGGIVGYAIDSLPMGIAALMGFGVDALLHRFRANAVKSAILLEQLATALRGALNSESDDVTLMRKVLEIETKFLANDDELHTKKFVWRHYLAYINC